MLSTMDNQTMGNDEEVAMMQPSAPHEKSQQVPANRDGEVSLSLGRMKSQSNLEMEANGSVDSEMTMEVNLESHRLARNKRNQLLFGIAIVGLSIGVVFGGLLWGGVFDSSSSADRSLSLPPTESFLITPSPLVETRITEAWTLSLDGDYDTAFQFANTSEKRMFGIAETFVLGLAGNDEMNITILDVKRGSIIIDYLMEGTTVEVRAAISVIETKINKKRIFGNVQIIIKSNEPTITVPIKVAEPTASRKTNPPTGFPTSSPTTDSPTTDSPTTGSPTTGSPTTGSPTTGSPTTGSPTSLPTAFPTTGSPTSSPTASPTTGSPTSSPTVSPTTISPTSNPTSSPTTSSPTTASPTMTPTLAPTIKEATFRVTDNRAYRDGFGRVHSRSVSSHLIEFKFYDPVETWREIWSQTGKGDTVSEALLQSDRCGRFEICVPRQRSYCSGAEHPCAVFQPCMDWKQLHWCGGKFTFDPVEITLPPPTSSPSNSPTTSPTSSPSSSPTTNSPSVSPTTTSPTTSSPILALITTPETFGLLSNDMEVEKTIIDGDTVTFHINDGGEYPIRAMAMGTHIIHSQRMLKTTWTIQPRSEKRAVVGIVSSNWDVDDLNKRFDGNGNFDPALADGRLYYAFESIRGKVASHSETTFKQYGRWNYLAHWGEGMSWINDNIIQIELDLRDQSSPTIKFYRDGNGSPGVAFVVETGADIDYQLWVGCGRRDSEFQILNFEQIA